MRIVIQKVKQAKVIVNEKGFASIGKGLVLLVGIAKDDTCKDVGYLANKIKNMRIFDDSNKKMNLNITQINGEILSVPQFTLYGDMYQGNRPGFDEAAPPEIAKELWKTFNDVLRKEKIVVKEGQFAAKMQVALVNDGPATFYLDSK